MSRKYSHVKMLKKEIYEMKAEGKTNKEIAQHYGFDNVRVVKNLINRHNRSQSNLKIGNVPKQRGRKPAITLQEYKYENKRLRMENELLRDFLCETERGCVQPSNTG